MTDAPEKIFASPDHEDGWRWPRASQFPEQGPYQNVPYRRDDLPATREQIMASPEVRALVDALEAIRNADAIAAVCHSPLWAKMVNALAAFKAMEAKE